MNDIISIIFGSLSALTALFMVVVGYFLINENVTEVKFYVGTILLFVLTVICAYGNFDQIERRK